MFSIRRCRLPIRRCLQIKSFPNSSLKASNVRNKFVIRCESNGPKLETTRPPFPLRLALVGTTTALATPAYTAIGIYRLWANILPQSALGSQLKKISMFLIGGSTITLFVNYALPLLKQYSDLVAPFALANGVACSLWYSLAELYFGLDTLLLMTTPGALLPQSLQIGFLKKVSTIGGLLGVLTALTAPLLWSTCMDICWTQELKSYLLGGDSVMWLLDVYYSFSVPLAIPIGFVSGMAMQTMLQSLVTGSHGVGWTVTALPMLLAVCTASALYFWTSESRMNDFFWVQRMDARTGKIGSCNTRTGKYVDGCEQAVNSVVQREMVKTFHNAKNLSKSFFNIVKNSLADLSQDKNIKVSDSKQQVKAGIIDGELYRKTTFDINVDDMSDLAKLYLGIDYLVRYKYLQIMIEEQKLRYGGGGLGRIPGEVDWTASLSALKKEFQVTMGGAYDVGEIFQLCENFCYIIKRYVSLENQLKDIKDQLDKSPSDYIKMRDLASSLVETEGLLLKCRTKILTLSPAFGTAVVKADFSSSTTSSSPQGPRILYVLSENITGLEKDLAEKIGYRFSVKDEEKVSKIIENTKWEGAWGWRVRWMYLALLRTIF